MCLLSVLEPPAPPCVAEKGMLAKLRSSAVSLLNAFPPQTVLLDQAQENLFMQKYATSISSTLPPYRKMQLKVTQYRKTFCTP